MEGGAAEAKDSVVASDLKQPKEVAGGVEPQAQKEAQVVNRGDEVGAPKAPYKEDIHVAAGGESHKHSQLGARGVPLGNKEPDDVPQNNQAAQLKDEERSLDKEKEKIDDLKNEQIEKVVQARLEKEQLEKEIKEKLAREQELEKIEKERIDKEVQVRLEKERQEKERQEKLAREQELERIERERIEKEVQARLEKERLEREKREKQELEKERIEMEVQARVEKERLEREKREKQELENERALKEKLAQEKAAEERHQQEIQRADNEILERARKEKNVEEARERLAQLERAVEAKKVAQGAEREDGEALKNGGRDLKEKAAAQADPREGVEDGAVKVGAHPQGSHEKARDQGEMDLRRRRRALGPGEAGGPPKETRAVPGLEPLLELGGSDLHAALEEQLLAGAMVHSRQIKQASEDKGAK